MIILLRAKYLGETISILESEHEITIETSPTCPQDKRDAIQKYLENEGILDEILSNPNPYPTQPDHV